MNLRRLNRVLHRDLGYLFFGMTLIYAVSGIALNHRHQWNPNYIIENREFQITVDRQGEGIDKAFAQQILADLEVTATYRTHVVAGDNLRIFVQGGSVNISLSDGAGGLEVVRRRPVFNQINFLHYNTPKRLWTWFSDLFAVGLIVLAVTGLFILRGKEGLTGRGAWLTGIGILVPILFLILYL